MGSFNTKCFVSNQTIAPEDECYIIPIKRQSGYNPVELTKSNVDTQGYASSSFCCYSDCFWKPVGEMISCVYDDYGQVLVDETEDNKMKIDDFKDYLKQYAFATKAGENSIHDHQFNPNDEKCLAWETMWDVMVSENRVFVDGYNKNKPSQLSFAIVSKQAYDYLISTVEKEKTWDGRSMDRKKVIEKLEKDVVSILLKDAEAPSEEYFNKFDLLQLLDDVLKPDKGYWTKKFSASNIIRNGLTSENIEYFF